MFQLELSYSCSWVYIVEERSVLLSFSCTIELPSRSVIFRLARLRSVMDSGTGVRHAIGDYFGRVPRQPRHNPRVSNSHFRCINHRVTTFTTNSGHSAPLTKTNSVFPFNINNNGLIRLHNPLLHPTSKSIHGRYTNCPRSLSKTEVLGCKRYILRMSRQARHCGFDKE